ncbi:MAG: HlyD family efflux transporter periplasmic adaptor subunit [Anaerolineales bacterium]|nr:HlyD family efflux transporter periplasmic adaptor subunit [Anaerolineales bacterium]
MMKKLMLACCLLLFVSACGVTPNPEERRTGSAAEPTPIPTAVAAARPTYEVARGTVTRELEFNGRVVPVVEQALTFPVAGVIAQIYVRRGEQVRAGDLVAELDTSAWEAELLLAQGALAIAQDKLNASQQEIALAQQRAVLRRDLAQLDLEYAITTAGENPTPAQAYEINRLTILLNLAQLDVDELATEVDPELAVEVDAAALRVAELEEQITQADLIAPFDGVVTALSVSEGRAISSGEAIATIADPVQIEVSATLREGQMEELSEGMAAVILPTGRPGDPLSGFIRRMPPPFGSGGTSSAAESDQTTRIQFDDMDGALAVYETGDRVNFSLVVTAQDDVLWLPPAAIRDFNGRKFVVVQDGDVQQRVDVELGIEGNGRVEIVSGLEEGQRIVGQ